MHEIVDVSMKKAYRRFFGSKAIRSAGYCAGYVAGYVIERSSYCRITVLIVDGCLVVKILYIVGFVVKEL